MVRRSSSAGGLAVALPTRPRGEGVVIVVNPSAGSLPAPDPVPRLEQLLPAAELHRLAEDEDLTEVMRGILARPRPPAVLGVCGGDGSVAAVAEAARQAGLPLLVVPGGTFNHFARAIGVPSVEAAADALAGGRGLRVDVAELITEGSPAATVLNAVSVGIYPDFVAERERVRRRLGKWLGGLLAAARVLRAATPVPVRVNGRRATVWSLYVGVNRNSTATVAPLQRRRLGDGLLDIRVLRAGSRRDAALSLAFGRRSSMLLRRLLPGVTRADRLLAPEVAVTVGAIDGQPPPLVHDGELWRAGDARTGFAFTVRTVPGALLVYGGPRAPTVRRARARRAGGALHPGGEPVLRAVSERAG